MEDNKTPSKHFTVNIALNPLYVLVEWPWSQTLMEEDWFGEEAILTDNSAYFIPINRAVEFNELQISSRELHMGYE